MTESKSASRRRVVTKKPTRNGCRTCRIRKVKCGEEKPSCLRCTSTGRACDGYEASAVTPRARRRYLLPSDSIERASTVPHVHTKENIARKALCADATTSTWANPGIQVTDIDRHGWAYFQKFTGPYIEGISPLCAWVSMALQVSSEEACVFHAVSALGTMQRSLTSLSHPALPRPVNQTLHTLATQQYVKAVAALRKYVEQAACCALSIEPILLSCLLCAIFESFRSKSSSAINHVRLGAEIVNAGTKVHEPGDSRWRSVDSADFFSHLFRWDTGEAALHGRQEHHDGECRCLSISYLPPPSFASFVDAISALKTLAKASDHLRSELLCMAEGDLRHQAAMASTQNEGARYCIAACWSRAIPFKNGQEKQMEKLVCAHTFWSKAYTSLPLDTSSPEVREVDLELRIMLFGSFFAISTCRITNELETDAWNGQFASTLELIEQYLDVMLARMVRIEPKFEIGGSTPHHSFSFGISLLPALNLICYKCRQPELRQKALRLLRSAQRREGMEYNETLARYAEIVSTIEGRQGGNRFSDVVISVELKGQARVFAATYKPMEFSDYSGSIELKEYEGTDYQSTSLIPLL